MEDAMRTTVPDPKQRSSLAEAALRWGSAAIVCGHPSQPPDAPRPPVPPSVAAVVSAEAA